MKQQALGALRDAVYDLSTDHRTWLSTMGELYRPFFPNASRVAALDVKIHKRGASLMEAAPADPAVRGFIRVATSTVPKAQIHYIMQAASVVGSFTEWVAPLQVPNFWSSFALGGVRLGDFVGLRVVDGGDRIVGVMAWYGSEQQTSQALRRALEPIAAHTATMFRLRRSLGGVPLVPDHGAAVLEVDGRCAHASGDASTGTARDQLRQQVKQVERAKTRSETQAGTLWKPLVNGCWTLVDRYDTDGRRYYVAVENDPHFAAANALSRRERQVCNMAAQGLANKEIAYALGLTPSSVATYVRRGLEKLRLSERSELPLVLENTARPLSVGKASLLASVFEPRSMSSLTRAEREVAKLAALGRSDQSIAEARHSSPRTVANLLRAVYKKLHVANRTELVRALHRATGRS